jgi:hypothetical protein
MCRSTGGDIISVCGWQETDEGGRRDVFIGFRCVVGDKRTGTAEEDHEGRKDLGLIGAKRAQRSFPYKTLYAWTYMAQWRIQVENSVWEGFLQFHREVSMTY